MRALNVFLAIAISLVMGLAVLEGGLRLLGMGKPRTMNAFDDRLGWAKKPGTSFSKSTSEYDVTFEINQLGLRDDPMSRPDKPSNTFRVLMLGDSFTLGFSVPREELFVDQLESWWRAENRRVDVINAGTEGYSTDQSVAWLLDHGALYQPDLVLLFPYDNDLYWNGQPTYMGKQKPRFTPEGQLERERLEDSSQGGWMSHLAITRPFDASSRPDFTPHIFTPPGGSKQILKEHGALLLEPPPFIEEAKQHTLGALRAFKRVCDTIGAKALVVPIPSHAVVDKDYRDRFGEKELGLPGDRWSPNQPVDTVLKLASEAGLRTLDPRTTLKATSLNTKLYYDVDWHFNADGNAAFAMFLHDELDHTGAFPPEHQPAAGTDVALPRAPRRGGTPGWMKLFGVLWLALTGLYLATYRDEPKWHPPLKVGLLLTAVFTIVLGGQALLGLLPPSAARFLGILFVLGILGFIAFKLGRRIGTILELFKSFVLRGHWYLMPLVVVLLTIGSLLVVAASSPLVAPFIYTLF